jgi:hypothetical protein
MILPLQPMMMPVLKEMPPVPGAVGAMEWAVHVTLYGTLEALLWAVHHRYCCMMLVHFHTVWP